MTSKPSSRFLSASEVEDRIRNAGPISHILSPGGKMPPETASPYDADRRGSGPLAGFALKPPTISAKEGYEEFKSRVYLEWLKESSLSYNGDALLGMTYMEATGTFRLDSFGPGPHPGGYFLNETELFRTLESLASVAIREAVKQHLTEGGDERLHLAPTTGVNKYYCPPHPVKDMVIRGSCTCSPPSQYAFDAACSRLSDLWYGLVTLENAFDDVRARISTALGIQTSHHVILHPSGTDAEFTPLLVGASKARALGCTGIVNIVVGAGEVGSNTPKAAGGHHFSKFMPNGRTESSARLVSEFPQGTRVIELKARRLDGSMMVDFDDLVIKTMQEASNEQDQPFFIMHAVDGSKLGSHITSRELVNKIQNQYGDRVLVVLDACQGRTEKEELDWYLSHGATVLITASKFYGAPGFCAAALVPDSAASHLVDGAIVPTGLGDYLTKYQVPAALKTLHSALPAEPRNVGLLLRWTCGVTEMERLARLGHMAREGIRRWVRGAEELIRGKRPFLELLVDGSAKGHEQLSQLGGVNSIVSFKLLSAGGSRCLETATLRRVHQWLTTDISDLLPSSASVSERGVAALRCFVGQPVDLGDFAILRLAIGASLACDLAEDVSRLEEVLRDDSKILDKIVLILKYREVMHST